MGLRRADLSCRGSGERSVGIPMRGPEPPIYRVSPGRRAVPVN